MRRILHLPFAGKVDVSVVRPAVKHVRWRYDSDVADPLRRLEAWRNEGGAGRPKPL